MNSSQFWEISTKSKWMLQRNERKTTCVCMLVSFSLINLRAARDECALNMLLEKMAFGKCSKKVGFPLKSGWESFVNRVWKFVCGSYDKMVFFYSSKTGDAPRRDFRSGWMAAGLSVDGFDGGWFCFCFLLVLLLWVKFVGLKTTVILWREFFFSFAV